MTKMFWQPDTFRGAKEEEGEGSAVSRSAKSVELLYPREGVQGGGEGHRRHTTVQSVNTRTARVTGRRDLAGSVLARTGRDEMSAGARTGRRDATQQSSQ